VGSFFVLQLRLGAYRLAGDLNAFQDHIGSEGPRWERAASKSEPVGLWCQEVPGALAVTSPTWDFKDWQAIVKQLKKQPDFRAQPYFHMIEGIFESDVAKDGPPVPVKSGEFQLRAGKHYELRIVHYDPEGGAHSGGKTTRTLSVAVSDPALIARTNPQLLIDSPYDAKSVVFITGDAAMDQYGSILIQPGADPAPEDASKSIEPAATIVSDSVPETYLPIRVRANGPRTAFRIILFAVVLSGTQLAPALLKADVAIWAVAVAVVIFSMFTSTFVNLGMRKPF
jgi:hypothetical protein